MLADRSLPSKEVCEALDAGLLVLSQCLRTLHLGRCTASAAALAACSAAWTRNVR